MMRYFWTAIVLFNAVLIGHHIAYERWPYVLLGFALVIFSYGMLVTEDDRCHR